MSLNQNERNVCPICERVWIGDWPTANLGKGCPICLPSVPTPQAPPMRLTTLSLTVGRTINLGNFNSLRLEAAATCAFDHGEQDDADLIEAARGELREECRRALTAAYAQFHPEGKEKG